MAGLGVVWLAAVTLLFLIGQLPITVAVSYWAFSAICFLAYAWDKSSARRGGQRISENALHLFSLLGGWPGALVAQQLYRHKTIKKEFRTVFWITVAVNVTVVAWLLSTGTAALPVRI